MKKQLTPLVLVLCGLLQTLVTTAQDIHFSQFFEAPLYRNPALAGIVNADVRVQTLYRSQWNSVANAYHTSSVNAEYKLPVTGDDYVTMGMQVFYDRSGTANLTTTQLFPVANYHKSLSSERSRYLSVGFMGGWVQRRLDRSKITTNSTYDGQGDGENALLPKYSYFDGTAGISYNSQIGDNQENNLVVGVAYHHFNKPKNSFFNNSEVAIQPKLVVSADLKLSSGDAAYITLHNDYVQQGTYRETLSGAVFSLKLGDYPDEPDYVIGLGSFIRWGDAIIPTVQLAYKPFTASVSYDVNMSKLSTTSYGRGGGELSLTWLGMLDRDNSSKNSVLCPRF